MEASANPNCWAILDARSGTGLAKEVILYALCLAYSLAVPDLGEHGAVARRHNAITSAGDRPM